MALRINGRIAGSPIGTDASPNATEPPTTRIITTPQRNGHVLGGSLSMMVFVQDGTSATVVAWVRVPDLDNTWHALNAALLVTSLAAGTIANVPSNADVFLQVTAVVGNPTVLGFACV